MQGVYGIHNTVSDKWYVGQTVDFATRWRLHLVALRKNTGHNTHFKAAWDKYGAESFEFVVLEEVRDVAFLTAREAFWIEEKRVSSAGVYNKREATSSNAGIKYPPRPISWSENNAASRRGQKRSLEARARMSAAHLGKPLTPERNATFSATMKGRKQSSQHVRARVSSRVKNGTYCKVSPERVQLVRALSAEGYSVRALKDFLKCSESVVYDIINGAGAYSTGVCCEKA